MTILVCEQCGKAGLLSCDHRIYDADDIVEVADRLQALSTPPQPEGCTVADKVSRIIEGYAESYDMMGRINPDNYSFCASVSVDLRRNILGAILAALQPEKTK